MQLDQNRPIRLRSAAKAGIAPERHDLISALQRAVMPAVLFYDCTFLAIAISTTTEDRAARIQASYLRVPAVLTMLVS